MLRLPDPIAERRPKRQSERSESAAEPGHKNAPPPVAVTLDRPKLTREDSASMRKGDQRKLAITTVVRLLAISAGVAVTLLVGAHWRRRPQNQGDGVRWEELRPDSSKQTPTIPRLGPDESHANASIELPFLGVVKARKHTGPLPVKVRGLESATFDTYTTEDGRFFFAEFLKTNARSESMTAEHAQRSLKRMSERIVSLASDAPAVGWLDILERIGRDVDLGTATQIQVLLVNYQFVSGAPKVIYLVHLYGTNFMTDSRFTRKAARLYFDANGKWLGWDDCL